MNAMPVSGSMVMSSGPGSHTLRQRMSFPAGPLPAPCLASSDIACPFVFVCGWEGRSSSQGSVQDNRLDVKAVAEHAPRLRDRLVGCFDLDPHRIVAAEDREA